MILALESSARPASVAICSDAVLLGQYFQNSGLTHSRTLLAMAESLLRNLDLNTTDIDLVAVSKGPGSFTGVRLGVSAAKGLAWGIDKPVCGVSTLEAMAYQATGMIAHQTPGPMVYQAPGPDALLCPVMDARRSQVYNAMFEWHDGALARLCDDRAISLEDLSADLAARQTAYDPARIASAVSVPDSSSRNSFPVPASTAPIYLVGDGTAIVHEHLSSIGVNHMVAHSLLRWQTAYGVALAAATSMHIPAAELEPSYLRPSQAERVRSELLTPNS